MSLVASHEGGEACVCDLADAFELSQPTISHHLKVLHDTGLLERQKRGVWVYYRARTDALAELGALIGAPAGNRTASAAALSVTGELVASSGRTGRHRLSGHRRHRLRVAASRLSPSQPGLQLLENSIATGTALTALILALQPVSAAFNPVVTLVERALGTIGSRTAGSLILAQLAGAGARRGRGQPDVRAARDQPGQPAPFRWRALAGRTGRHHRPAAGDLRCRPDRAHRPDRLRRRRLPHRRLLVHQLHQLRQPGGDPGPLAVGQLRRYLGGLGPDVRPDATARRRRRLPADPAAVPAAEPAGLLAGGRAAGGPAARHRPA